MPMIRKYRSLALFVGFIVLCTILVVRQFVTNESRHLDLREAFILLHSKGYQPEAERLFQRLLDQVDSLSDASLWSDYQRTLTLVDPTREEPSNLIWQYHWTLSHELEKRSQSSLQKALKLAEEK
jgi:hypothetical protein